MSLIPKTRTMMSVLGKLTSSIVAIFGDLGTDGGWIEDFFTVVAPLV